MGLRSFVSLLQDFVVFMIHNKKSPKQKEMVVAGLKENGEVRNSCVSSAPLGQEESSWEKLGDKENNEVATLQVMRKDIQSANKTCG